jgi:hypothetical protein
MFEETLDQKVLLFVDQGVVYGGSAEIDSGNQSHRL